MRARPFALVLAAVGLVSPGAHAEPPWVDRHVVLPEHDWAFDFGIGVAHDEGDAGHPTGTGMNFEAAVSPVDRLELGVRTGLRIGTDGQTTRADAYGRLFDRPSFGTNHDVGANPELRVRGALTRGEVVEVAVEGRLFLPAEHASNLGVMFGVPLLFHLGRVARIDTGVYVPVVFDSPVGAYVSLPVDLWFQVTRAFWLGPMSGVVYDAQATRANVPFGLGLGYQALRNFDIKGQFLFPELNQTEGAQTFGFGVAMEVRIE
jgi:hypothetical protein